MTIHQEPETFTKIAYTLDEAVPRVPFGRTKLGELIRQGKLKSYKKFGKRYVMHEDLVAFLMSEEEGE